VVALLSCLPGHVEFVLAEVELVIYLGRPLFWFDED
jgi:hypothetical protein